MNLASRRDGARRARFLLDGRGQRPGGELAVISAARKLAICAQPLEARSVKYTDTDVFSIRQWMNLGGCVLQYDDRPTDCVIVSAVSHFALIGGGVQLCAGRRRSFIVPSSRRRGTAVGWFAGAAGRHTSAVGQSAAPSDRVIHVLCGRHLQPVELGLVSPKGDRLRDGESGNRRGERRRQHAPGRGSAGQVPQGVLEGAARREIDGGGVLVRHELVSELSKSRSGDLWVVCLARCTLVAPSRP